MRVGKKGGKEVMNDNRIYYTLFTQFEELGKMTVTLDKFAGKAFLSYFCESVRGMKTGKKPDTDSMMHLCMFSKHIHEAKEEYMLFLEAKSKEELE